MQDFKQKKNFSELASINHKRQKKIPFSTTLLVSSLLCYIFLLWFLPSLTRYWTIILVMMDFLFIFITNKKRMIIDENVGLLLIFTIISIFGLSFAKTGTFDGLQYVMMLIIYIINYILLVSTRDWIKPFFYGFMIILVFFTFGTILQIVNPELVLSLNRMHLSDVLYQIAFGFYYTNLLTGFTYQTGVNGFIISIFMSIIISTTYLTEKKKTKILLWIIAICLLYLLLLTGKRGFLIYMLAITMFILFKMSKNKIATIVPVLVLAMLAWYMLNNTQTGINILVRTFDQSDISTGRFDMFSIMWEDFLESPFLGKGTYSTASKVNAVNGHNIYLQILRENGLVAFIVFLSIIIINIVRTNNILRKVIRNTEKRHYILVSMSLQFIFILWGITGNTLYDPHVLIFYFIAIAITRTIEINLVEEAK